jgi:isoleucyl-tRNA synthetase
MSKIQKVPNQVKFSELEDKINQFWKENRIFEKSIEQRSPDELYSFMDGPPFVSGSPHYASLLPSIAKDVIPRFWTMKGKRVRRVFGWDCHGLPIEEKINRKFSLSGRKQVEKEFGVEKYVRECRSYVTQCTSDWRWYIDKIGRWVDLDNAYYTMSPEFGESVVWAFKQIWDKGFIYKGKRTSMFSTDTSTPVSEFEVAMDSDNYREVEDLSIYVKFRLRRPQSNSSSKLPETSKSFLAEIQNLLPEEDIYLLAWTTTPWTIPSNFALAVNPETTYCLVRFEGHYYILAKSRIQQTFDTTEEYIGEDQGKMVKIIKEFQGNSLEGLTYKPVYNYFVEFITANDFKIYPYNGVSEEEGTGILHAAPAFGQEDAELGRKHGISDHRDIDEEGKITVGPWKGTYLRDVCPQIAENLWHQGNLLRSQIYKHRVPFYRGKNPLIYMSQEAYFIDIQKVKQRMLELNQDINWYPEHLKNGRFAHVLENSPDWCISRNRYWGTIMPLWINEAGETLVIGSFEELCKYNEKIEKRAENGKVKYYFEDKLLSWHRDVCDKIVLTKDGKKYYRVPEILDVWMDSGSVPFAEHHYPFENNETFVKSSPADYIVEYTGQIRAWFNILLRVSTILFDRIPFKNSIVTGVLAGNDGRKMSKSYGNFPDPKEVLNEIGAEALRLYFMSSPIMLGEDMSWSDEVLNEQVKTILIPLWNTYKYIGIYSEIHNWSTVTADFTSSNILDKWLESYMYKTVKEYERALENYDLPTSVKLIHPCIDNISTWWIRRSRDRFANGDQGALQTLYAALVLFCKTFAPQMPFICEEMYQNLVINVGLSNSKESVHLEDFPQYGEINERLLTEMEAVKDICSLGLHLRSENGQRLRQPLQKVLTNFESQEFMNIIRKELNVKEIEHTEPFLEKEGYATTLKDKLFVALDLKITPELEIEGLINDLIRKIQNLRKQQGFQMGESIIIYYHTQSEKLVKIIEQEKALLKEEVSASTIELKTNITNGKNIKIDNQNIILSLEK